jgi:hypothetical protein
MVYKNFFQVSERSLGYAFFDLPNLGVAVSGRDTVTVDCGVHSVTFNRFTVSYTLPHTDHLDYMIYSLTCTQ